MIKKHGLRSILLALALSLSLPMPVSAADQVTELNLVEPERGFSRVWRAYPDMDETFARDGTQRSLAQVRRVVIGNTKQQLVNALGQPVSANQDGSWNFNLKLPLPQRNLLVCQYQVHFNDDQRVTGSVWRRPQCADLVTGRLR